MATMDWIGLGMLAATILFVAVALGVATLTHANARRRPMLVELEDEAEARSGAVAVSGDRPGPAWRPPIRPPEDPPPPASPRPRKSGDVRARLVHMIRDPRWEQDQLVVAWRPDRRRAIRPGFESSGRKLGAWSLDDPTLADQVERQLEKGRRVALFEGDGGGVELWIMEP
jgi:hypothetical protein